MKTLPGLIDNNIEFFAHNEEPYVLQNGKVFPYEESRAGRIIIQNDIIFHPEFAVELHKIGYRGLELEKKWVICRFGNFDNIPDAITETFHTKLEYHQCKDRQTCKLSGIVCKLPIKI